MVPPQGTVRLRSYGNSTRGGDRAQYRVELVGVEADEVRADPVRGQRPFGDAPADGPGVDADQRGGFRDGNERWALGCVKLGLGL